MFSFFIIEHNYINRNNIRVENSFVIMKASDASPSLRGITPAAIHAASNRLLSNLNTNNMFSYSILSNLIELYPGSHVGRKLSVESSLLINVPTPKRIIEVSSEQFLISRNDILNQPVKKSTLIKIYEFERWNDSKFLSMLVVASFMGSVLNYSIFLCTTLNSALTTAVVGALKNVAVTYIGMIAFTDYNFSWVNFFGINLSIAGSLYYTYITIFKGVAGFGSG